MPQESHHVPIAPAAGRITGVTILAEVRTRVDEGETTTFPVQLDIHVNDHTRQVIIKADGSLRGVFQTVLESFGFQGNIENLPVCAGYAVHDGDVERQ